MRAEQDGAPHGPHLGGAPVPGARERGSAERRIERPSASAFTFLPPRVHAVRPEARPFYENNCQMQIRYAMNSFESPSVRGRVQGR